MKRVKAFCKRHIFLVALTAAVVIAAVNYLVYPLLIERRLDMVEVPIAAESIGEATQITADMLDTISISAAMLPAGVCLTADEIIGRYVRDNTTIPQNGFVYGDMIGSAGNVTGKAYKELREGEYAYTIFVGGKYDQNNTLKANLLVNIYVIFGSQITGDKTMFGQLGHDIRIISVNSADNGEYVIIALSEAQLAYFSLAEAVGAVMIPTVHSGSNGITGLTGLEAGCYDIDQTIAFITEHTTILAVTEQPVGTDGAILAGEAQRVTPGMASTRPAPTGGDIG